MRNTILPVVAIAAMVGATPATPLLAQPAAVNVRGTSLFSVTDPKPEDWASDFAASRDGKFVYLLGQNDLRVLDRATGTRKVILTGRFTYVTVSAAGDRLVFLRPAEGAQPGPNRDVFIWSVAVDSRTGATAGEPRKLSMLPADAPRLSPDGSQIAFIATGSPRKMMVMPANGGVERVLFERGGPRAPVRWSPDAKWIYFSQPSGDSTARFIVSRVAVEGGTPVAMTPPVEDPFPGLSPDGAHIGVMLRAAGTGATFGLFDLERRLVGSARLLNDPVGEYGNFMWSGNGLRMLYAMGAADFSLRTRPLEGGAERDIPLGGRFFRMPSMSPDGRRIAMPMAGDSSLWEVVVQDVDGKGRKKLAEIQVQSLAEPRWSPNGRYLAYWRDGYKSLAVTDLTTGQTRKVATAEFDIRDFRWTRDSRALRFISVSGTQTAQRPSVREADLDGKERIVRDLTPFVPAEGVARSGYANAILFGESVALTGQGLVVPLAGGDPVRLYPPLANNRRTVVSEDGRWLGLIAQDRKSVEIIRADGSARRTMQAPGAGVITSLPIRQQSGEGFLVATDATPSSPASMYLVPFADQDPRLLLALPPRQQFNDIAFTFDGRGLLYERTGVLTLHLMEVDLAAGLRSRGANREQ